MTFIFSTALLGNRGVEAMELRKDVRIFRTHVMHSDKSITRVRFGHDNGSFGQLLP